MRMLVCASSLIALVLVTGIAARSDASCAGIADDYVTRAAAVDWTVAPATCTGSTTPTTLPDAPRPMVVTRQKINPTGAAPFRSPTRHPAGGDPVLGDGEFYEQRVDITLAGLGPHFEFKRTYRSRVTYKSPLGYSWDHSYDQRILGIYTVGGGAHIAPYCDGTIEFQDGELNVMRLQRVSGSNPPFYMATGVPYILDTINVGGVNVWRLRDGDGVSHIFDTAGYLSQLVDAAGNALTFTWEASTVTSADDRVHGPALRLAYVQDGARTVHYRYTGETLQCLTLGPSCGTATSRPSDVLVYFDYNTHGDLRVAYHGQSTIGETLVYRDETLGTGITPNYTPWDCLPNASIVDACSRLCGAVDPNNPKTCQNLDLAAPVDEYCRNWQCWLQPPDNGAPPGTPASIDCSELPAPQSTPDALCLTQYGVAPTCQLGCERRFQCLHSSNVSAYYSFGHIDDIAHNITDVYDETRQLVVHNSYGEVPSDVSFDRVVSQQIGAGIADNVISFSYHDLAIEGGNAPLFPPPNAPVDPGPFSTPDPTNVVPANLYSEGAICPSSGHCVIGPDGSCGIWTYNAPTTTGEGLSSPPVPTNAVVVHDLHGVVRTQYFDTDWNLIRESNLTAGETTDYNYDWNGYTRGVLLPSGMRVCTENDSYGTPIEASTIPAGGYNGVQTPQVEARRFDGAHQLVDAWSDVLGTLVKVHYTRDSHERIVTVDRDVALGQAPERTLFSYDEDPAPVGIRETPASETLPNGTVDKYLTIDSSLGGPQTIILDANGALPEQRSALYDSYGRLTESGEANRYAVQYGYDSSNKLAAIRHRVDFASPWVETRVSYHEVNGDQLLDSVVEPHRTTTYTNLGEQPNVVTVSPASSSYGEGVQTACQHFSADGRFEGEILPQGNEISYQYDAAGRLTSTKKGFLTPPPPGSPWRSSCAGRSAPAGDNGMITVVGTNYAKGGFPLSSTKDDLTQQLITDGFGRIIQSATTSAAAVTQYGYDTVGRVIWRARLSYAYALPGSAYVKPVMTTSGLLGMTEYSYDLAGRIIDERHWLIETGEIQSLKHIYDDANRAVTVNDRGAITTTITDGRGRVTTRSAPDGSTTTVVHQLNQDTITQQTNQAPLVRTVQHDTRGNVTAILDEASKVLYAASYDDDGNQTSEQTAGGATMLRYYDSYDRLYLERKDLTASGTGVKDSYFAWDANDRLARYNGWTIGYTGYDKPLTLTDPLGRVDRYSYVPGFAHPAGRVDPTGRHACLRYDGELRLAYLYNVDCPAGQTTIVGAATPLVERRTLGYNERSQLADFAAAADAAHGAGSSVTFSYDTLGRETAELVASSNTTMPSYSVERQYGDFGRSVTTTISGVFDGGGGTVTNFAGKGSSGVQSSIIRFPPPNPCDSSPWLCPPPEPTYWSATFHHAHDLLDRISSVDLNGTRMATWSYGVGAGGPLSLTYANGAVATFAYDNRLRQKRMDVLIPAIGSTPAKKIASLEDAFGIDSVPRMRQRSFGTADPLTDAFRIDGDGRVTGEHPQMQYTALPAGEIDNTNVAQLMTWGDSRNYQLGSGGDWVAHANASTGYSLTYDTVDSMGRLSAMGTKAMTIDAHDNLVGLATDTLGFTFDADSGMPLTAHSGSLQSTFSYDALDRRSTQVDSTGRTTVYIWAGAQLVAHGTPPDLTIDVPGDDPDEHIASVGASGVGPTRFYHQGVDRSVLAVSDANGLVEGYAYGAFGDVTIFNANGIAAAGSSAIDMRFGFQGQLYDSITSTYAMRARIFVPKWGRFISPDPYSMFMGPTLYAFAGGRPLHFRDPSGMASNTPGAANDACLRNAGCGGSEDPQPLPPPGGGDGDGPPPGGDKVTIGPPGPAPGPAPWAPDQPPLPSPHGTLGFGGGSGDEGGGAGGGADGVGHPKGVFDLPPDRVFASNDEPKGGHDKGKRPSTREKHEDADRRRGKDQRANGGEKADESSRRPQRKRPDGWRGPWPRMPPKPAPAADPADDKSSKQDMVDRALLVVGAAAIMVGAILDDASGVGVADDIPAAATAAGMLHRAFAE